MEGSTLLIKEAKQVLVSPGDAESQQRLAQVSLGGGGLKDVSLMYFKVNSCMCTIKTFRGGDKHTHMHKKHIAVE